MTQKQFEAKHPGMVEWGISSVTYWGEPNASLRIDRMNPTWRDRVWSDLDSAILAAEALTSGDDA